MRYICDYEEIKILILFEFDISIIYFIRYFMLLSVRVMFVVSEVGVQRSLAAVYSEVHLLLRPHHRLIGVNPVQVGAAA